MLTVRLNEIIENQLKTLVEYENKTKSEVIKEAISEYYANHLQAGNSYEMGKDLFGNYASGISDKSTTYKKKIKGKINAKHSH